MTLPTLKLSSSMEYRVVPMSGQSITGSVSAPRTTTVCYTVINSWITLRNSRAKVGGVSATGASPMIWIIVQPLVGHSVNS